MRISRMPSSHSTLLAAFLAMSLGSAACSDDDGATTADAGLPDAKVALDMSPDKGSGLSSVSFKSLTSYSVVKGTTSLEIVVTGTASKAELLADGKVVSTLTASPWTFSWDSSGVSDGLVKLQVKASAGSSTVSSTEVPVVILNKGVEATWTDGNSGEVIVPSTGYVEQHLKFHWKMPLGITKVLSLLTWDKEGFKLELAIGVGNCPDSGTTAAKQESATSPAVVTFANAGGQAIPEAQWFGHVDLVNETDTNILGKKTAFKITTYLLK